MVKCIASGSGDFVVSVWNLETGALVSRMGGLMAPVTCMTLTSNDAFLIVSCEDETLRVFSLCSGTELHELSGHEGKVHEMVSNLLFCFVHFGQFLNELYCMDDRKIRGRGDDRMGIISLATLKSLST